MLDDFMRQGWNDQLIMSTMAEQFIEFVMEIELKAESLAPVRERFNAELAGIPHRARPVYRESTVRCIGGTIAPWDSKINPIGTGRLELAKLGITEIPRELFKPPFIDAVRILVLQENLLTEVPREMGRFSELVQLKLQANRIETVHADIGKLKNLRLLYLSNNQIKILPWEMGKLVRLETLMIDYNLIEYMPITLARLTSVIDLRMNNNPPQKSPPANIARQGNKAMIAYLRQLDIGDVTGRLELKNLGLTLFPHEIMLPFLFKRLMKGDKTLTCLNLSHNNITDIKDDYHAFGVKYNFGQQLSSLTSLSLDNNNLKHVPHCIILLSRLTSLNLEGNAHVTSLPVELCTMTNLTELRLTLKNADNKNQFRSPPSGVLRRGVGSAVYSERGHVVRNGTAHVVIDYLRMIQVRYHTRACVLAYMHLLCIRGCAGGWILPVSQHVPALM